MVYYKLVKVNINTPALAEVIIKIIMQHHDFLDLIMSNYSSVFTLKFWFLLYCFFKIKYKLLMVFYLEIDS